MSSMEDRKLAAIMFTNIVGYSSMMSADESTAVKSLRAKESILNRLTTNHNGNLVKNIGDGTVSYYIMTEDRWYSVDEISNYLGINKETLYKWLADKDVPAHKVGNLWKYRKDEIGAWVSSGGTDSIIFIK